MKRTAVLAASVAMFFSVISAAPALAGTGVRDNCGTVVSGVNAMQSRTGSYTVTTYPKACWKRYFQGSYYVYYMPWTKTPDVLTTGNTVGSDLSVGPVVTAKIDRDGSGNVTAVRYDFVVTLKTAGGNTMLGWQLWVYPSGTQLIRLDPSGAVYDSFDNWD
ncbi:hypothetical protein [Arthrobacter sp. NEB 688]|uniref:hypothetical protein n=1 Tax=Arthrobacter sp. NEB 688 TaxID=904039 RepID=UPI00156595F8|nr:hypothetical protein [Arthrobacter sp. NEB 688]QKE85110.1 hypothetical protein HL663_14985 [Arthrobacter sp. NEB 688]